MPGTSIDIIGGAGSTIAEDRLDGLSSNTAIKGPCAVATTAPIALEGEQTIDGVLTSASRVLVKAQANVAENGIYMSSSGPWRRTKDFSRNNDLQRGALVNVVAGVAGAGLWQLSTPAPIEIGVTDLTFDYFTSTLGFITAAALVGYVFTGDVRAPTPSPGDNDTSIATTAFVAAALAALAGSAPDLLNTLDEIAAALGDDPNFATTMLAALADCLKHNVADQTLTGGVRVTSLDLGTPTAASTVTLDPGDRPMQHLTNNALFTLAPGSNFGTVILDVTNGAAAGAITTSGYNKVEGSFTLTNGHKFTCLSKVGQAGSLLQIVPMQ